MTALRMNVDAGELQRVPGIVERIWIRSVNRSVVSTARWATTRGLRAIAKAEGISITRLRKYKRAARSGKKRNGVEHASVWFGLRPVPASARGKMRQLPHGAKAGPDTYEGGFVAKMASGHTGIFFRQGPKRPMKSGRYVGRIRQPIVEQMWHLTKAHAALQPLQHEIPDRLRMEIDRQISGELRRGGA